MVHFSLVSEANQSVMEMAITDKWQVSYTSLIGLCDAMEPSSWSGACMFLEDLRAAKLQPNIITFTSVVSSTEFFGQWQLALSLLVACSQQVQGNILLYNAAISATEQSGRWQCAMNLLSKSTNSKLSGDVVSFNATMSACNSGGAWRAAIHMLEDLNNATSLEADIISYNSAISACEKNQQWKKALMLLAEALGHRFLAKMGLTTGENRRFQVRPGSWPSWTGAWHMCYFLGL